MNKEIALPTLDMLREKEFRESIKRQVTDMAKTMTPKEQAQVSFVPLVITRVAWIYGMKAIDLAVEMRVSEYKKLCRVLKECKNYYDKSIRFELGDKGLEKIKEEAQSCIDRLSYDFNILYFSVNQEMKRCNPDTKYEQIATFAAMSVTFFLFLKEYYNWVDDILRKKLGVKDLTPTILPQTTLGLYYGMSAMSECRGIFNYQDKNVKLSMKVIENALKSIEFVLN